MSAIKPANSTKKASKATSAPQALSLASAAVAGPSTGALRKPRPNKTKTTVDRRSPVPLDDTEIKLLEALSSAKGPERRAHLFKYVAGVDIIQAEAMILNSSLTNQSAPLLSTTLNDLATRLANVLKLRKSDAAGLIGVSTSAISRKTPPSTDVLDRMLSVSAVFADVTEVLGAEGAQKWFNTPNRALGDQAPVTLLNSRVGEKRVQQVIGALLDGAYL